MTISHCQSEGTCPVRLYRPFTVLMVHGLGYVSLPELLIFLSFFR